MRTVFGDGFSHKLSAVDIQIIVNGSRRKALKKASFLQKNLPKSVLWRTQGPRHATELAEQSVGKCDLVISVGGDGTLHEVVQGLMKEPNSDLRPALAVLKAGTGNDFARNLSYNSKESLLAAISGGEFLNLDIGYIEHPGQEKTFFINSMDVGFGFATVEKIRSGPAILPRFLVFPLGILSTFLTYKPQEIECVTENFHYKGRCLTTVVANGPWFGGGIGIAPDAELNDGFLHLTRIGNVSMFHFLKYLPLLKKGRKINHPEVFYIKTKEVEITGPGGIEADGEMVDLPLPVKIGIIPSALKLLK